MRSVLIIHAIISRGRVIRLMSTVHVTHGVQYEGRPHSKVQRRVLSQISLGRVLRLMAAGPLTRVCIQYNGRPRRYSCDYQPWAGHPPRNHGPRDTSYAFNIMVDLAPISRRIGDSCNHWSWVGHPHNGHGPLNT